DERDQVIHGDAGDRLEDQDGIERGHDRVEDAHDEERHRVVDEGEDEERDRTEKEDNGYLQEVGRLLDARAVRLEDEVAEGNEREEGDDLRGEAAKAAADDVPPVRD